jgi:hypothetical protein
MLVSKPHSITTGIPIWSEVTRAVRGSNANQRAGEFSHLSMAWAEHAARRRPQS